MNKRLIAFVTIIVIVLAISFALFNSLVLLKRFRVTSIDPPNGVFPTSQTSITLTFNKNLAGSQAPNSITTGATKSTYKISDKTLVIKIAQQVDTVSTIDVVLDRVVSVENEQLSAKYTFNVRFVDYKNLTEQQQKEQVSQSDSFETDYPLVAKLPYIGSGFDITYEFPSKGTTKMPIIITTTTINTSDPLAAPDAPSNIAILRTTRTEAVSWLKQNGYDTNKYQLYFTEPYITEEFGGYYLPSKQHPDSGGD